MADAIPFSKPAKTRPKSEASGDELLAFERLLVDLSSQFANLAGEEFETVTQTALREFGNFSASIEPPSLNFWKMVRSTCCPPTRLRASIRCHLERFDQN